MNANPPVPAKSRSRSHPRAWPITVKLSLLLVFSAVLPMLIVGYVNLRSSLDQVEAAEFQNLEQLAMSTAGRMDQFIVDSRHQLVYFAWSDETIQIAASEDDATRVRALDKMIVC